MTKIAAQRSDGIFTAALRDQGVDADLYAKPSMGETLKREIPSFAAAMASYTPKLIADVAQLAGRASGHAGAVPSLPGGVERAYAQWFNDRIGDPTKSLWKNTLYRMTSGSDGKSLGSIGLGPAITSLYNQFKLS
jgi:hypothetical protein